MVVVGVTVISSENASRKYIGGSGCRVLFSAGSQCVGYRFRADVNKVKLVTYIV